MDLTKALESQQDMSAQAVNVKKRAGILGFFSSTQQAGRHQSLVNDSKVGFDDLLLGHDDKPFQSIASDKPLAHCDNGHCNNKGAQNKDSGNLETAKVKEQRIKNKTRMTLKKGNSADSADADSEKPILDSGREAQEIDYVVFLKSLTQDSASNTSEKQHLSRSQMIAKGASANLTLSQNNLMQSEISEISKNASPLSTLNTSIVSEYAAKCQGQSLPEGIKSKPTNAFIMLMQARVQKQDVKSSEACFPGTAHNNKTEVELVLDDDKEENVILSSTPASALSIANFFTKCHKTIGTKSESSAPLVVKADVHGDPSIHKKDQVQQKTSNMCSENARNFFSNRVSSDNGIVFLESETIQAKESESDMGKSSRAKQTARPTKECSKHFILPTILVNSEANKTDQVANKTTPRSMKALAKNYADMSETSMKKKEFLHHSPLHSDTGVKKAQAVLNFGRSGNLEASMPVKTEETKLQQSVALINDSDFKKDSACLLVNAIKNKGFSGGKNSTRKKRTRAIESDVSDPELSSQNKTRRKKSCTPKISLRVRSQRLSKSFSSDSGNSLKDFTPSSNSKSSKFNNSTKATAKAKALVQKARILRKTKASPTFCADTKAMKNQTSPRRKRLLSQSSANTLQTASSAPALKEKQTPKRIKISPSSLRNLSQTPFSANSAARRLIKSRTPIPRKSASDSTPVMTPSQLCLSGGKTPLKQGARVQTVQNSALVMTPMMTPSRVRFQGGRKAAALTSSQQQPERVPINQKESSQKFLGTPSRVLLKEKMTLTPAGRVKQACHSFTKPMPQTPLPSNDCIIVEAGSSSELKSITPDPWPGLRRSSRRLAEQQKLKKETADESKEDCISIESDESDNEGPKKRKLKNRGSISYETHLTGKLAPIFTKKKDADTAKRCPQPVEDPELVKKRREFLMSGVPMELKRQTAVSAQPVSTSDFTPFPIFNHVQQKEVIGNDCLNIWSLPVPEKMNLLQREINLEAAGDSLLWSSLQWKPTPLVDSAGKCGIFHTSVPVETVQADMYTLLLKELPVADTDVSFSAFYDKFRTLTNKAADNCKPAERTSTDPDLIVDDEVNVIGDKDDTGQWPDVLQPLSASEIMGNKNAIRRLKSWLQEWKDLIRREARLSARTTSGRPDSDFDFSDSDSQGSQLCNTMLLVGPHGVGKTAAVYALANQLSFKVFEVNASSSRQGRLLLSQLQEATQSHQVAQKKDGLTVQLPTSSVLGLESQPTEKVEMKTVARGSTSMMPTAFAKFFHKPSEDYKQNPIEDDLMKIRKSTSAKNFKSPQRGNGKMTAAMQQGRGEDSDEEIWIVGSSKRVKSSAQKSEGERKVHGKKDVRKEKIPCLEKEIEDSMAGCLNLSSTSLILFDEVDLVFEEDSGFLQAVQQFITTTKIPIIMTTSDPGFQHCINARFETLQFQPPRLETIVGSLQAAALAGGMRTSYSDMCNVARQCKDLRRAFLSLQFLVQSGGGSTTQSRPLTLQPAPCLADAKKTHEVKDEAGGQEQQREGEFFCLRGRRKKARRILDEDDDSDDASNTTRNHSVEGREDGEERPSACSVAQSMDAGSTDSAASVLPVVHLHLAESLLGVQAELNGLLSSCLKNDLDISMLSQLSEECQKLQTDPLRLCSVNLLRLLPLTKTTMPPRWFPPCKSESVKSVKRKRIKSDIFDSDRSDDEMITSQQPSRDLVIMPELSEQVASSAHQEGNRFLSAAEGHQMIETSWSYNCKLALGVKIEGDLKTERNVEGQVLSSGIAEVDSCGTRIKADRLSRLQNAASSITIANEEDLSVVETGVNGQIQPGREPVPGTYRILDGQILSSFARYWETLSAADLATCRPGSRQKFTTVDRWHLLPGINDVACQESEAEDSLKEELRSYLGVLASREMWRSVDSQVASWKVNNHDHCDKGLPPSCSIPMPDLDHSAGLEQWTALMDSVPSDYRSIATSVMDSLPLVSCGGIDHVTLDYLPSLRTICLAEHCRKIAKTKRRFHHHFDSIGLSMAESTISALCNEFPARAQNCLPS